MWSYFQWKKTAKMGKSLGSMRYTSNKETRDNYLGKRYLI